MAAVTAAIVGALAAVGSTVHAVESGKEAQRRQGQARDRANAAARQQEQELAEREADEQGKANAVKARNNALSRQRRIAAQKQGRQGTILGGSGGASGSGTDTLGGGQGKSLLGV